MSLAARSPIVATVDLTVLLHNLTHVQSRLTPPCEIIAVVKADAYGHGAIPVARALCTAGVQRLCVATVDEGLALRQAGLTAPILVLGATLPDQLDGFAEGRLTPVLHDTDSLLRMTDWAVQHRVRVAVHVKLDTGMGRLGFKPHQMDALARNPVWRSSLNWEGLMAHLADADGGNPAFTQQQIAAFRHAVDTVAAHGLKVPLLHMANSAGILRFPASHGTAVRPGIMLYGYHTLPPRVPAPALKPVLSLAVPVIHIHELHKGESTSYNRTFIAKRRTKIAVLPIGYADGYSRSFSNKASVLIGGSRAPVVGRVCMDMTMVDVTRIPQAVAGTDAVIIGRQGADAITADDLAAWQKTISYEVLCGLGPRVRRVYKEN